MPLVFLLLSFPFFLQSAELTLIRGGKSSYTIVLAREASPSERRGAEELQRFLEQMSEARLPIAVEPVRSRGPFVFVGRGEQLDALKPGIDFDKLGPEDFAIKTLGKHLVIAGGRKRGTMYGVSTFLEKLGCRWFTRDLSRIPNRSTVTVPGLDEVQRPAFEMRWPGITEAFDKDWAARNRVNGGGLPLDSSTGGRVECYPCGHSFHTLIPPARYFAAHPEYFALVDGQRRQHNAQLCLTNAAVIRAGVEQIFQWIKERPGIDIIGVFQEDWGGWCECDNCKRVEREEGGAHSGPIVRFVNALAEAVSRQHPDKRILTYAYQYSEPAPTRTAPHPNVRIQLAPISACIGHPAETCPRNQKLLMDNLKGWARLGKRVCLYGYATNFAHYVYPMPDFDRLAADIPMLLRHGVTGVYYEGSHQGEGGHGAELRAWVMAKLMWNPNENMSRLVDEFFETAYEKAAAPMRRVFDLMHQQVRLPPEGRGRHLWIDQAPWMPPAAVDQAAKLYADATAVAGTDAIRRRIRKDSLWVDYARLFEARRYHVRGGWYQPSGDVGQIKARFRKFWEDKTTLGIGLINYSGLDVEKEFPRRLVGYRVETLENAAVRVDVAPGLSGRVIRWIDKATGRNLLREPNTAGIRYPDGTGEYLAVHPDPGGDTLEGKWTVESRDGSREIVMKAVLPNGLAIRRRLRLPSEEPRLAAGNVVENRGPAPKDVEVRTRFDMEPADPEQLTERQNAGEIVLRDPGSGITVTARYLAAQVKLAQVSRDDRHGNRASVGLRTPMLRLGPGESARLDVEYTALPRAIQ
ncbi:MAG: DUF4838 domain-containing protein [Bryobacteraceae bacterium]